MGLNMSNQQPFDPTPRPALRKASDPTKRPPVNTPKEFDQRNSDLNLTSNTSDSLRAKKSRRLIAVTVSLPRSLRRKMKKEAKSRGVSFDELVAERLTDDESRR